MNNKRKNNNTKKKKKKKAKKSKIIYLDDKKEKLNVDSHKNNLSFLEYIEKNKNPGGIIFIAVSATIIGKQKKLIQNLELYYMNG